MDTAELETFEKALITACDKHIASGGKLIQGRFVIDGTEDKCICPLRAAAGKFDIKEFYGYSSKLTSVLGFKVTDDDIKSFYFAYDDTAYYKNDRVDEKVWAIGLKMREKYNPEPEVKEKTE